MAKKLLKRKAEGKASLAEVRRVAENVMWRKKKRTDAEQSRHYFSCSPEQRRKRREVERGIGRLAKNAMLAAKSELLSAPRNNVQFCKNWDAAPYDKKFFFDKRVIKAILTRHNNNKWRIIVRKPHNWLLKEMEP